MSKESVLISLNSKDAISINGTYKSNLLFNLPNIVNEDPSIKYLECSIEDLQIPVAWYLINDINNKLHYTYNSQSDFIQLTNGNYTGSTLITELQNKFHDKNISVVITLSSINGLLLFKFFDLLTEISFNYNLSKNIMEILGFSQNVTGFEFSAPNPLNLLGVLKLNVCSKALSNISSYSSNPLLNNNIIQTISVDVPFFFQLTYINKVSHYQKLKARYLDSIDILLLDDNNNFIEMNNIDWSITISLYIYRENVITYSKMKLIENENVIEKDEKDEKDEKNKKDEKDEEINDLDILNENNKKKKSN